MYRSTSGTGAGARTGPAAAALRAAGPATSPVLPRITAARAMNVVIDDRIGRPSGRARVLIGSANLRGSVQL